jgi:hypothetical protein
MAMYENRGYCPANAFSWYREEKEVSATWKETEKILGDRIGYMVYSKDGYSYSECYVVDALVDANSFMGIEIAMTLQYLIPVCKYAEEGRPIICTDLINPYQMPAKIRENNGIWELCVDEDPSKTFLFQDERYLVSIQDDGKEVHMYLYKK